MSLLYTSVIVKATNGPRYVVGCRRQIDKSKLKSGTRVALDMTTLTIMRLFIYYINVWTSVNICTEAYVDKLLIIISLYGIFFCNLLISLSNCRYLPREVDPLVYNMSTEDPGDISYSKIGGLAEQIRELREVFKRLI